MKRGINHLNGPITAGVSTVDALLHVLKIITKTIEYKGFRLLINTNGGGRGRPRERYAK